jgi:hypothetical protein
MMATAKGTVYRSGSKERIAGAAVKAYKGDDIVYATTDDDGDFDMAIPEAGTWKFVVLDEKSFPNPPKELDMTNNQSGIDIYLHRTQGQVDEKAGKTMFWVLLGVLGGLLIVYLVLHLFLWEEVQPLSQASLDSLERVQQQLIASPSSSQEQALIKALADFKGDLEVGLSRSDRVTEADIKFVNETVLSIETAIEEGQAERARSLLDDLYQIIDPQTRFAFWATDPLRMLEILFWGLAGVLVNKIIITGWYLRSHRFYQEGVLMHIAHIVTTPLLVLVAVLILSLVNLNFSLTGGNEMSLDLSDPRIMVAFAFIIGTSPWPLWRFIENAGKRFSSQFD